MRALTGSMNQLIANFPESLLGLAVQVHLLETPNPGHTGTVGHSTPSDTEELDISTVQPGGLIESPVSSEPAPSLVQESSLATSLGRLGRRCCFPSLCLKVPFLGVVCPHTLSILCL